MKKVIEKRADGTIRVKLFPEGESKTRQELKTQTDINHIMNRFVKTGQINHITKSLPFYGDVTNVTDYRSALDAVNAANESFLALPSKLRNEFGNDPARLIDFLNDPANTERAQELGLVKKIENPADIPVKIDPKP